MDDGQIATQFAALLHQMSRIADAIELLAGSQADTDGNEISFQADELVPETLDGEVYWKIKGGDFRKHGVRVWPEVLEQAGLVDLAPRRHPLTGWRAVASRNGSGKPKKIVRLERPGGQPLAASGQQIAGQQPAAIQPAAGSQPASSLRQPANSQPALPGVAAGPGREAYLARATGEFGLSHPAAARIVELAGSYPAAHEWLPFFGQARRMGLNLSDAVIIMTDAGDAQRAVEVLRSRQRQRLQAEGDYLGK